MSLAQEVSLTIGTQEEVTKLFSWPNCMKNCPIKRDLFETVHFYLESSLRRDGFTGNSIVVTEQDGKVVLKLSGPAARRRANAAFLAAGALGEDAAEALQKAGEWRADWRFFLPLGLALKNQIPPSSCCTFPPTSVLEETQDYLAAHTTSRWAGLSGSKWRKQDPNRSLSSDHRYSSNSRSSGRRPISVWGLRSFHPVYNCHDEVLVS